MTTKKPTIKTRNEQLADIRFAKLQAKQRQANNLKAEFGYVGSVDQIIRQHQAKLANDAICKLQILDNDAEQQYVTDALNGPSQHVLKNWLKDRLPTYDRVKRFFDERPNQHRVKQVVKAA